MPESNPIFYVSIGATSTQTITYPEKNAVRTPENPNPMSTLRRQEFRFHVGDEIPDKHVFTLSDTDVFIPPGKYLLASKPGAKVIGGQTFQRKGQNVQVLALSHRDWALIPLSDAIRELQTIEPPQKTSPAVKAA
jgi:hypothetical protein